MLDSKLLRSDPAAVAANLARRGFKLDVATFTALEERRKAAQVESDRVRAERNANAKAVGMAKGKGEDASALLERAEELTGQLAASDAAIAAVQSELDNLLLGIPNLLHESVPDGSDESAVMPENIRADGKLDTNRGQRPDEDQCQIVTRLPSSYEQHDRSQPQGAHDADRDQANIPPRGEGRCDTYAACEEGKP